MNLQFLRNSGAVTTAHRTGNLAGPLVAAEDVSLVLGGHLVLDKVSLAVSPGEIVTLIGPNGAGKSSFARLLLGLVEPTRGRVTRAAGLNVGYVPQRFSVPETVPLTVRRLLTLTLRASDADVARVLDETGISHLAATPVSALSGGEQQRALIARALLRNPDFLVLDEPVQGVDFIGEAQLYGLVSQIRTRRGCGILMVSHDLHVVMAESDRVVCLNGHVCCEGGPETVKGHPEFAKLFGPEAARALAVYSHEHDHVHDGPHAPHVHGNAGKGDADEAPPRC
jgi:zinc transport system ATP-binding protein